MSDVWVARLLALAFAVPGLVGFVLGLSNDAYTLVAAFGATMVIVGLYFAFASWQLGRERRSANA